jgi:16S rRNA (cytosine967-C5)-methyltransferase
MPAWILSLWERDYGLETALELAKACLGRPPLQLRVNTVLSDRETVKKELEALGVHAEAHPLLQDGLTVSDTGAVGELPPVREGRCYVQDAASQLCALAVDPQPGETVFDLCAAPGSKSFTMAQLMQDTGRLLAFDLHPHRAKLVQDGAERLGLHCIMASAADATVHNPQLGLADRVLCDVPCAGLGVIRRKPEIRRKTAEEVAALPAIQQRILNNAANYLRPGGILVYSTCSLNQDENDRVAAAFLAAHPDFIPAPLPEIFHPLAEEGAHTVTLMPHRGDYDGFYIARFQKRA